MVGGLQVQYNPTLTRADLELLDKKILLQMMRNRIVLAFNKPPMWNRFGLDKIEGISIRNIEKCYYSLGKSESGK